MNRKAFTLVELLVVIAIISLLLSILAPSLNIAHDIAKQIVCANNMSATGRGLHMYCQVNNGRFPPYRSIWSGGQPKAIPHAKPEDTFWVGKVGDLDPVTLKPVFRSLGFLYKCGQLPSSKYYYCPAQTGKWYVESTYTWDPNLKQERPWGTFDQITNMIRIGYLWNTWGKLYSTGWDFAARTIEQMENDKALVIDHALFPWYVNVHMAKGSGKPTFNVAFSDAHVESITSDLIVDVLIVCAGSGDSGGAVKKWEQPGNNNDFHDTYRALMISR